MQADVGALLTRLALLEDPVRRALYFHVARRGGNTSRDQAARAMGVSRALAAFHLDKLVRAGLLEVSYRRLNRRRGPGAGRPSKLYRPATVELSLSLPAREYGLAAELFAEAFAGPQARAQLDRVARRVGRRFAAAAGTTGRRAFVTALERHGYAPSTAPDGTIVLHNCPFDALARTHKDLVCGMNRALVHGFKAGAALTGYQLVANDRPGECCALLRPARKSASR
ncbi:MAG TPA: helix-turn-helix domain-containing protein [Gemmatimonadales bacterium]|nr:helix-turn-helix domain-containing protein [Gemmatimonadales bacterium]